NVHDALPIWTLKIFGRTSAVESCHPGSATAAGALAPEAHSLDQGSGGSETGGGSVIAARFGPWRVTIRSYCDTAQPKSAFPEPTGSGPRGWCPRLRSWSPGASPGKITTA